MPIWLWILVAVAVLGAAISVSVWGTGRFVLRKQGAVSSVIPPGQGALLDTLVGGFEASHPGHSGASLVEDPAHALALRLAMAQMAERSLDLLYYIWDDDLSGRFLAQSLLEAADRGVRVRLLLDDVNVLDHDPVYRALDRHANIDVRLFNPIRNRDSGFRRGFEIVMNLLPYNRRMHGKLWITDGRLAITGGRNIGDEYFGLSEAPKRNFDDLDMLLAGAVLRDTEALFDAFWNSGVAFPIRTLWPGKRTRLNRFRKRLRRFLAHPESQRRLVTHQLQAAPAILGLEALQWSPVMSFLADPPQKALAEGPADWLPASLEPLLRNAQASVRIMTPYLVPGDQGLAQLLALVARGVKVEIITNGLALADNAFVHGAYRWYRKRLLAAGVSIFEVCARSGPRRMLHTKAFLIDNTEGFVGTFNFDMRSAFLNTEMGVVFRDPALIDGLRDLIDETCLPQNAYHLALDGRWATWSRGDMQVTHLEPESTVTKRVVSFLIGHLPIHRFL